MSDDNVIRPNFLKDKVIYSKDAQIIGYLANNLDTASRTLDLVCESFADNRERFIRDESKVATDLALGDLYKMNTALEVLIKKLEDYKETCVI